MPAQAFEWGRARWENKWFYGRVTVKHEQLRMRDIVAVIEYADDESWYEWRTTGFDVEESGVCNTLTVAQAMAENAVKEAAWQLADR